MKKLFKVILIIIGFIIAIILEAIIYDIINAKIFKKSPIISKYEALEGNSYVDRGIIFDVYYCHHSADIVLVSWKFKTTKFTCPVQESRSMIDLTDHVFIKTYTIEKITKEKNSNYQSWTISQLGEADKYNVKVANEFKVKENTNYEITFKILSNDISDNIESIFKYSKIILITETDKDINQFIR